MTAAAHVAVNRTPRGKGLRSTAAKRRKHGPTRKQQFAFVESRPVPR